MPRRQRYTDYVQLCIHISMSTSALPSLFNKSTVCERLCISPRRLELMVKEGSFPPPVRLGKCVYWSEAAVSNWHQLAFLAQEHWTPAERHIREKVNHHRA